MSTVYTPTPVVLGDITLISDGDPKNASGINAPIEAVADGIAYIHARAIPLANVAALAAITTPQNNDIRHVGANPYVFLTAAAAGTSPFRVTPTDATPGTWVIAGATNESSITRKRVPGLLPLRATAAAMTPSLTGVANEPVDTVLTTPSGAIAFSAVTTGSAIANGFMVPLNDYLIQGAQLITLSLKWLGAVGHAAVPSLLPQFAVVRIDASNTVQSLLIAGMQSVIDPGLAGYNGVSQTDLLLPNQYNTIDKTAYHYAFVGWNEGHTNAVAGLKFQSLEFLQTVPDNRRA